MYIADAEKRSLTILRSPDRFSALYYSGLSHGSRMQHISFISLASIDQLLHRRNENFCFKVVNASNNHDARS